MSTTNRRPSFDVIVIGAGAAGLAAASTLAQGGARVCVLEARDRIGGRIFSRIDPDLGTALELGAEFVHGRSESTTRWLRRFNTPLIDASQTRFSIRNGELEDADRIFDEMKSGLARVRRPKQDLSFADFLQGPARKVLSARAREFARTLVEGFDAADAARVSALEILAEWSGSSAADAPTFRPQGGYGALLGALAAELDSERVQVHLDSVVIEVKWKRADVQVRVTRLGATQVFRARYAIVTLPIGVLQLPENSPHAVRFSPPLRDKASALAGLASGPVIKVLLHFNEPFWERLDDGRFGNAAFFHAPDAQFPTFWTGLPVRVPLLNAWCAGPNAARLSGFDRVQITRAALDSLTQLFGTGARVGDRLRAAHVHDWQADPFACGAYSSVTVGGRNARRTLARPIQNTLYLAGEAADTSGEAATVAGALRSGESAARSILRD